MNFFQRISCYKKRYRAKHSSKESKNKVQYIDHWITNISNLIFSPKTRTSRVTMFFKILFAVILFLKIRQSLAEYSIKCVANNYDCIALKKCPDLLDMLLSSTNATEVQKYQCGFNSAAPDLLTKVLVCCPDTKYQPEETNTNEMLMENVEIDNSRCGVVKPTAKDSAGRNGVDRRMLTLNDSDFPWMALIEYVDTRGICRFRRIIVV